jgi:hypothetical protein
MAKELLHLIANRKKKESQEEAREKILPRTCSQ